MSEILLGQHISHVYTSLQKSIDLYYGGRRWDALLMLKTTGDILYYNPDEHDVLDQFNEDIRIAEEHASQIKSVSNEEWITKDNNFREFEAGRIWYQRMHELRLYMQKNGYFVMMNKGWGNTITPTATMKAQVAPPQTKKYSESLPSEIL
jgi:hypothetical protein